MALTKKSLILTLSLLTLFTVLSTTVYVCQRSESFSTDKLFDLSFDSIKGSSFSSSSSSSSSLSETQEQLLSKRDSLSEKEINDNMKGQYGEDRYVFEKFFKSPLKKEGFFVEIGALDGVHYSNSYFFEKLLKWDGLLVEATPVSARRMMVNRKATYKFSGGVCEKKKNMLFATSSLNAVNGNVEYMSPTTRQRFLKNRKVVSIEVRCNTLSHYLGFTGKKYVDFMSIDIEGGELDALKGFDWDVKIGVLAIEITNPDIPRSYEIKDMLIKHGYRFDSRINITEIWVGDSFTL